MPIRSRVGFRSANSGQKKSPKRPDLVDSARICSGQSGQNGSMNLLAPLASGIYIGGGALVVILIIVVIVLIVR
jgi:hypothetical protein